MSKRKLLNDGDDVIYHYLQKILQQDEELFPPLVSRLIADLGIWLSPTLYQKWPVLVPFAVRDNSCRKGASKDGREHWGEPAKEGFFRDDNSLIKGLPKPLRIRSSASQELYDKRFLGKGYVASHAWRVHDNPETNSFIPNLVWLPKQVSKLTDRPGSFAQRYPGHLYQALPRRKAPRASGKHHNSNLEGTSCPRRRGW
ncbi:MAG: hypothetical protein HY897_09415 [Deltaproteobacteria bacterium]|nr:hypothetical protein [Deltaproteobacteria bacterium]